MGQKTKGKMYIVATPIGNLKDITLRALDTLESVDIILSEDTRRTLILLNEYKIKKPLLSYRDQNHSRVVNKILKLVNDGKDLALTSDSGTPLISDPGYKLVVELIENGIEIVSIPGPSSIVEALVTSGLPIDKFTFLGFLPKKKGKRKKLLEQYGKLENSLVIFESPYRIQKLLYEILETLGNRQITICKELTKLREQIIRGRVKNILHDLVNINMKGEITVVISKKWSPTG